MHVTLGPVATKIEHS